MPPHHPNDPTDTTLDQPDAVVTADTVYNATMARLGTPVPEPPVGP